METTRIILADDQVLFVESLKVVIETRAPDIRVVGIAHDGDEVFELVKSETPNLVLMDVRMPGTDGVAATRLLQEHYPGIRVLMLTTYDDDDYVFSAMQYGASGYLLKDTPPDELVDSIRAARTGQVLMSPKVATKMASIAYQGESASTTAGDDDPARGFRDRYRSLSAREREIFLLMAKGYQNREIAGMLSIADQTVKNHVSDIYFKVSIHNRGHLMRLARKFGLIE